MEMLYEQRFVGHRQTEFHQTWYRMCLWYSLHELEVRVIPRSKVETGNMFELRAILFVLSLA